MRAKIPCWCCGSVLDRRRGHLFCRACGVVEHVSAIPTVTELRRLWSADGEALDPRGAIACRLGYELALRPAELRWLEWAHYDEPTASLRIARVKGGKAHRYALTRSTSAHLDRWLGFSIASGRVGPFIFPAPGSRQHGPCCRNGPQQWVDRHAARMGVLLPPGRSPLRACAAAHLLAAGCTVGQIAERLGHARASTTDHYLGLERDIR